MRIALCLSGQARRITTNFNAIKENLLDTTGADVFFHFWSTVSEQDDMAPLKAVDLYHPKQYIIEPQVVFEQPEWFNLPSIPITATSEEGKDKYQRIRSMFYSIWRSNELKKTYEKEQNFKYDCVIRSRTDIFYECPFDIEEFNSASLALWGWDTWPKPPHGPSFGDWFAFGSSEIMDKYSMCHSHVDNVIEKCGQLLTENVFYRYVYEEAQFENIKYTKMCRTTNPRLPRAIDNRRI